MNNALNPPLYHSLERNFGSVRIANPGQVRRGRYLPDPSRPGRLRYDVEQRGEQYRVPCRFCGNDQGHHLYVSYWCGLPDPIAPSGNYSLWYCHRRQCHRNAHNQALFRVLVAIPIGQRARLLGSVAQESHHVESLAPVLELPDSARVDTLPCDHPAVAYLFRRGFDPACLAATWDVRYVSAWTSSRAANRLLIPAYHPRFPFSMNRDQPPDLVLAGWQARTIGEAPAGHPKYLFPEGMQKSQILYGLPQAVHTVGPAFVCEGVTDVWRIGPGGVATFGKSCSHHQKLLMCHHFMDRPIVILPDADAVGDAQSLASELRSMRSQDTGERRVVVAQLANGRDDPAESTREEIVAAASQALMHT